MPTCSLWAALAGIAKTSTFPMTTVCLLIFRACAALLVAGVYPVKSSAYDSTGKADYAFSPSTRRASTAGVQPSYLLRQCVCCERFRRRRRTCRLPAPLHAGSGPAHDGRRSRRPVRFHADADLVLADHGIGQVVATVARRGLNYFQRGGALATGKCAGNNGSARSKRTA